MVTSPWEFAAVAKRHWVLLLNKPLQQKGSYGHCTKTKHCCGRCSVFRLCSFKAFWLSGATGCPAKRIRRLCLDYTTPTTQQLQSTFVCLSVYNLSLKETDSCEVMINTGPQNSNKDLWETKKTATNGETRSALLRSSPGNHSGQKRTNR